MGWIQKIGAQLAFVNSGVLSVRNALWIIFTTSPTSSTIVRWLVPAATTSTSSATGPIFEGTQTVGYAGSASNLAECVNRNPTSGLVGRAFVTALEAVCDQAFLSHAGGNFASAADLFKGPPGGLRVHLRSLDEPSVQRLFPALDLGREPAQKIHLFANPSFDRP